MTCEMIGQMRAFTSMRHVPRNGFGEGRNKAQYKVASQRWMQVATNIKKSITSVTDQ